MATQVILKITPTQLDILRAALDYMIESRKEAYSEVPVSKRSGFAQETDRIRMLRGEL